MNWTPLFLFGMGVLAVLLTWRADLQTSAGASSPKPALGDAASRSGSESHVRLVGPRPFDWERD